MKKGLYFILLIAVVAVGYLIWDTNKPVQDEPENEHTIENVQFSDDILVEEVTFDSEKQSLRYVMKNNTGKTLEYGAVFTIMKLSDDNALIETDLTDDLAFDMALRTVEAGDTFSDEVLFNLFTEPIDSGTYYIIREYRDSEGNEHIPRVHFIKNGEIQPGK
ncbi:immunoglobulin-like domain-containing protein [Proteiniclasticum sp. C24MP]|uniref:immunoglobulin-like domain-containing protein n=1 Tax=Proteiniclasticum sp. C24MP TaxID=3374101 RepID=UPI003754AE6F